VPPPAKTDPVSTVQIPQPSIAPVSPPVIPLPPPPIAPVHPAAPAPSISAAKPVAPVDPSVKQPATDQSLVEAGTAGLAASAFDRLSQAVQEAVPQPTASDPGPSVGPNGRNLEDIVKELLRPMLKEWLDKNLPTMVERFVEREIVRLTRR
jgi:cell pole-organizing protein PopZ